MRVDTELENVYKCRRCGEIVTLPKSTVVVLTLKCPECHSGEFTSLSVEQIFDEQVGLTGKNFLKKLRIKC